jgi:hypothetical protein
MKEEKFTELVNLYLDNEISERGLAQLKAELQENAARKAEFTERCRLHQAMRLALNPAASRRRSSSKRSRPSNSRTLRSSSRAQPLTSRKLTAGSTRADEPVHQVTSLLRWITGACLVASVALGFVLLMPVFRDTASAGSQPPLAGVDADELIEADPLDTIGRLELRRFASVQEQGEANQRASIAAQLRLMGLRPELTPEEKRLRPISAAAAQRPVPTRDDAQLLAEVQKLSPMPVQQILRTESMQAAPAIRWPGGFQSSLASFK